MVTDPVPGTLLALERQVWEALRLGDAGADAELLSADFLGVYETGFADQAEHVAQLLSGATVAEYRLDDVRLLTLSVDVALLAYRAVYRRVGATDTEVMYVSSIWRREAGGWRNLFSQDTAEGTNRPV